jgi:hypothetical protein
MKPSMSAAVILVTTALRPCAASRSGSLDCLVCREVGPACAQRTAMLISGGSICLAEPSASGGDRPPAGPTFVSVRRSTLAVQVNPQQNATSGSGNGSVRNASKCSEMFRNAPLGMTYCLGGPAIRCQCCSSAFTDKGSSAPVCSSAL